MDVFGGKLNFLGGTKESKFVAKYKLEKIIVN